MLKKKNEIKNIISIDAYDNLSYTLKGQRISRLNKLTFDKQNYVSSYISNKEAIIANININNSIPEEDVESMLERKVYEELNLNEAIEYSIKYIELKNTNNEKERVFSVFIVEVENLFKIFRDKVNETKFIDFVVPMALLYKPLYTKEIISSRKTDIFLYITKEEASITVYKDGEYLYSKSIDYSFEAIYDKYCNAKGEKVDEDKFFKKLEEEGLKSSDQEYQQILMRILGELFVNVNDIVIYIKRAFNISQIDNFYIGSSLGNILGMDSYSNNYLGLESKEFNFDYGLESTENYIDQIHYLIMLNSEEMMKDDEYTIDFSVFPRPPAFQNRASGQFIISMFFGVTAAVALPLYFLVGSYMNEAKIYGLNTENTALIKDVSNYKRIISEKQKKLAILNKSVKEENEKYFSKIKTLDSIYNKKVQYRMKSATFYKIAEDIEKFGIKVTEIKTDNDIFELKLISKNDKRITAFIKYISSKYFKELEMIDIKRINKEEGADYYTGILKIELKSKDIKTKHLNTEKSKTEVKK